MSPGIEVPLAEIQRRIRRLIAAPSGVGAALAEAGDPEGLELAGLVRGDRRLSAVDRLEIYANAYFYRILERLTEDFPALARTLGEAWFNDLVTAYLMACPPRHPSLRFAGDRLANFLADDPRADPFRPRFAWAADLARLEWAILDAFDAADAATSDRQSLARIPPHAWGDLVFRFQPGLQLLALNWPVRAVRSTVDEGQAPDLDSLARQSIRVVVWRADDRVFHREIDSDEASLLEPARAGETFGRQCARLADRVGDDRAPALAVEMIARWLADDWLSHVDSR